MLAAALLAAAVIVLATIGQDLLPQLFSIAETLNCTNFSGSTACSIALADCRARCRCSARANRCSICGCWSHCRAGWSSALLNCASHGPFHGQLLQPVRHAARFSHLVVMLALIAESNRLYARLALSTAARKRERDARLMSMDAVTAAIAHEVGQPLTAVGLNASAAVSLAHRREAGC